jgi:hypothetical protein
MTTNEIPRGIFIHANARGQRKLEEHSVCSTQSGDRQRTQIAPK